MNPASLLCRGNSLPLPILLFFIFPLLGLADLAPVPPHSAPRDHELSAQVRHQQIEEDWLRQAQAIEEGGIGVVSTETDARGGCDGIKDGKYAFHTAQEPNPWWQVDLGQSFPISRIVVFNRLDYAPGLHNADHLLILTSNDGKQWTVRHENKGKHFGGISGMPPLEVPFKDNQVSARFVRLQIPSPQPMFFHLDEVEVYGLTDPGAGGLQNLALHRPATQSSISQWSTAKRSPAQRAISRPKTGSNVDAIWQRICAVQERSYALPAKARGSSATAQVSAAERLRRNPPRSVPAKRAGSSAHLPSPIRC